MWSIFFKFFQNNWHWLLIFAIMSVAVFFLLRLQVMLREHTAATIRSLLARDPKLCLERLEHNRRLKWLFRKPVLLLWRLDCYLALGMDAQAEQTIAKLRKSRLEPLDKVELYQREISYFSTSGNSEQAKHALEDLRAFLKKAGAESDAHYAAILDEAEIIIGVYVEHNVGLIKKLIGRAEHTKHDIMRGITQYRIAKLAWFKGDTELMQTYLNRAEKNLRGTLYAPILAAARKDPQILETR